MTDAMLPTTTETRDGLPLVDLAKVTSELPQALANMERARRFGSAYFQRIAGHEVLSVSSLDLVTELADDQRFSKFVGPALLYAREFSGDGLFTAFNDEPNWAKAHDLLMPAFALGSMRTYHPVMLEVARTLLASWDRSASEGTGVNVSDDMTRLTLDTIGLAGFDFDFHSFESDRPHPFVEAMTGCLSWAMDKLSREPDDRCQEEDDAFLVNSDYLTSVVDEVIAARAENPEPGGDVKDLLGLMLRARHSSDGETLSAENIRNQVITFLIAGHETTSGTLAFALYFLAKNPEVLHRAQREVDELWGDTDDLQPTYEDIGKLRYLRQVLNESLRLWPAAPGFGRQALADTVIGDGIRMAAGESALVNIAMLHRDPVWGDNPELFDPSRFDPQVEADRSPHAFKPFGTGERACIGRQFALHEATMVLAMLIHRYRFVDHESYELRIKQSLTIKPDGFSLKLIPRTPADRTTPDKAPGRGRNAIPAGTTSPLTRVKSGTRCLFLHGTNYGSCRDAANRMAAAAEELGCATEVAPLNAYAGSLPTDRFLVVVAASYNGRPTDDAAAFVRWLETAPPGAAGATSYAVLGMGDRNWAATYQHVPTLIDRRLSELGGTRLLERAAADASGDLAGTVEAFTEDLSRILLRESGDPASSTAVAPAATNRRRHVVTEVVGGPLDALAARHGMVPMTVTETGSLTAPCYPRTKKSLRLALPDGRDYRTADHLAVLPANTPSAVERAAHALGADLDSLLNVTSWRSRHDGLATDRPLTVRELLTHHVELADRLDKGRLRTLAAIHPCPPGRHELEALADDERALAEDHRTVLDVLQDHPALKEQLTWPLILDLLPAIRPRTYSVSSSPAQAPDHVDLMVSVLEAPARSGRGVFRGTGSGYLASVRPGDTVLASVKPCRESFRITHDTAPVIMISAGTGLAPFRGAIADRRAMAEAGNPLSTALCYFGCDAPAADYLYADELRDAEEAGAVSMRPVYSETPVSGMRFVQHRIAAEGEEIWGLLEAGAKVYVCGDGRNMAPGVRAAFEDIFNRHGAGEGKSDGGEWLRLLMEQGLYVEDVYGA
ncbi:cytochrome P450 [Streptomyces sp. NPDC092307]|uniref:bifunctional cytochrome P450/NADPH--P450 reductase n=1 Tax=Streptomyces sp. NPDC092307 TaxID=3366013 RepID=UPI00380C4A15